MSKPTVLQPFLDLGRKIDDRWRKQHFDTRCFPVTARECLEEFQDPPRLDLESLLVSIATQPRTPALHLFGDLSIRIYHTDHFFVELLVWLDGHNLIHEHAFSGAFRVLQGGSIHSLHRFSAAQNLTRGFRVGRLDHGSIELLGHGNVREIRPGAESLHSLCHFERPSISLVVRTHEEPASLPQLQIERPHFAMDSSLVTDDRVLFCTRSVDTLRRLDDLRGLALLVRYLDWLDFPRAFALCLNLLDWEALWVGPVFEILATRFGAPARCIPEVLKIRRRLGSLGKLKKLAVDSPDRLILGLLMTVSQRQQITAVLEQRFGAAEAGERLAAGLARILLPTGEARNFQHASSLGVIRLLLENSSLREFGSAVRRHFNNDWTVEAIAGLYERLHSDPVLGPTFSQ